MNPPDRADFSISIAAGRQIELGVVNAVEIDDHSRTVSITVTQSSWLGSGRDGAIIDFAALVRRDGRTIGHTIAEPYSVVREGRLISLSGHDRMTVGVRAIERPATT